MFQEKYLIGRKLGAGSFGAILLGTDIDTGKYVAIKFEKSSLNKQPQLPYEAKVMRNLTSGNSPAFGVPKIHWLAMETDFNIMVMDLLGPSLADLFAYCGKKFSLKTTLMLADQILQRIEQIHKKNYIHRDIKPDNFLMGLGPDSYIVNVIDFGLSKKFRDAKSQQHIPYRENRNLTGTARYASLNAHLGIEQSRRDDLEAIGFCLIYFIQGKLPWQNLQANNRAERYAKIAEIKLRCPVEHITQGMPLEFANYMHYVRSLRFEDRPDYSGIRQIFKALMKKSGYEYDHLYDWVMIDNARIGDNIFSVDSFEDIKFRGDKEKQAKNTESMEGLKDEETNHAPADQEMEVQNKVEDEDEEEKKSEGDKDVQKELDIKSKSLYNESPSNNQNADDETNVHLNESSVNNISVMTHNPLIEDQAIVKQPEEKQGMALINRLGILDNIKPQKKFLLVNQPQGQLIKEHQKESKAKSGSKHHKHQHSTNGDDKCIII